MGEAVNATIQRVVSERICSGTCTHPAAPLTRFPPGGNERFAREHSLAKIGVVMRSRCARQSAIDAGLVGLRFGRRFTRAQGATAMAVTPSGSVRGDRHPEGVG